MSDEFLDIGSVNALLKDARERIKETEERCNKKSDEIERRLTVRIDDLDSNYTKANNKIIEWLPLLTNLSKSEENKRNMTLLLVVSFISNIASWILTLFLYLAKSGVTK